MLKRRQIYQTIENIKSKVFNFSLTYLVSSIFILGAINTSVNNSSCKINNEDHLEELVEQERNNIGMPGEYDIQFVLSTNTDFSAFAEKLGENQYRVCMSTEYQTLSTLRHEMYHIFDGHCEDGQQKGLSSVMQGLKYLLFCEPKACLYSFSELKL
jgi:hypothetical protein|tara:strand:+ start:699 stop:1166 length:468 start_codon:yes stop_codon:yes gene_type:complete